MKKLIFLLITIALFSCRNQDDVLVKNLIPDRSEWSEESFQTPPNQAKVQTWYHWVNGHISIDAINKDLESMKEVGLGGFALFNASEGTPIGNVAYYSDEWWQAFIHTKKEAKRLGLEMGIMNGPGWSASGGPWNTPENAMQEVVWTEKQINGPVKFNGKLSIPKPALGLQRDMKLDTVVNLRYYMHREYVRGYFNDIALLAFPTPKGELNGNPYHINGWWEKAGYSKMARYIPDMREVPKEELIDLDEIIDLTDKLDKDGNLQWDVPEGNWTILRLGYQPTGRSNHPAPFGGKGLEVNKMSAAAVDIHWKESVMKMVEAGEENEGKAISYVLIDSYEAGHQNWTKGFESEFENNSGYNMLHYLPAIAGRVVGSTNITEKFLWDYRKAVSDLINENYYKRFQTLAHQNDLSFAAEGYGNFGNTDDFSTGKYIDIPANEFWATRGNSHGGITKLASSTAHIYGRKLVGSEAYTGEPGKIFETNLREMKSQGDWFLCKGINQFWLHGYTHSPYEQAPGLGLGTYGSHFGRHNTWWKYSKGWFKYQARCQYMLQQGRPKNDILYFVGEDAPVDPELKENLHPTIPNGYDYDFCNRDILEQVKVENGKLVLSNGLEYAMLVVQESEHIRPEVLRILEMLIKNGAVVIASKPARVPGLFNDAANSKKLKELTAQIWGKSDGIINRKNKLGKGIVYCGNAVLEAALDINLKPDFEFTVISGDSLGRTLYPGNGIEFIHRQTEQTDVYFVSNQHNKAKVIKAKFRIDNKQPELWNAETGEITIASEYEKLEDGRIEVTLRLDEAGSVFVVFHKELTKNSSSSYKEPERLEQLTFNNPWQVSFTGNGAPGKIELPELIDISQHENKEVAYFSGTITYENQIDIKKLDEKLRAILNLGQVEVAAEIFVNNKSVSELWKKPYRIDITEYLKPGINVLRVDVANLWVNRVIGDQQLPDDCEWTTNTGSTAAGMGLAKIPDWVIEGKESPTGRKAFVSWKWDHLKNKTLRPSGLIGPVSINVELSNIISIKN